MRREDVDQVLVTMPKIELVGFACVWNWRIVVTLAWTKAQRRTVSNL
jgi:hypothetical protein